MAPVIQVTPSSRESSSVFLRVETILALLDMFLPADVSQVSL